MFIDFLGKEAKVGDTIIYIEKDRRLARIKDTNLVQVKITRLSDKTMYVEDDEGEYFIRPASKDFYVVKKIIDKKNVMF